MKEIQTQKEGTDNRLAVLIKRTLIKNPIGLTFDIGRH